MARPTRARGSQVSACARYRSTNDIDSLPSQYRRGRQRSVRGEGRSAALVDMFVESEPDAARIDERHVVMSRRMRQQGRLPGDRATIQRRAGKTEVTSRFVKSLLAGALTHCV